MMCHVRLFFSNGTLWFMMIYFSDAYSVITNRILTNTFVKCYQVAYDVSSRLTGCCQWVNGNSF